jgi:hypothetical protein
MQLLKGNELVVMAAGAKEGRKEGRKWEATTARRRRQALVGGVR